MKSPLVLISSLCLATTVGASTLFTVTPEIRDTLKADTKAYEGLMARARRSLNAVPLKPEELEPSGRNKSLGEAVICHYVGRTLSDWMEPLGWAWLLTGDKTYADKGVELLVETCRRFPIEQHWMSYVGSMAGGRGDMMRGLAMGYGLLQERMTQEQRDSVAAVAKGYVEHFLKEAEDDKTWWKNVHNFNGVCGGAAGLVTLAFGEYPDIAAHRDHCAAILERWFEASIDPEGAYAEGAGYSQYGYSNSLLFAWLLKDLGGKDLFKHPRVCKLPQFYAASMIPGTSLMEARNDCGYGAPGFECLLLAVHNQDGLAAWLWQHAGTSGYPLAAFLQSRLPQAVSPETVVRKDILFPERGLCVWRTGWSKDDVMFSTEAGHYYHVTHNQSDKGHFALYAYGQIWAGDPGYGNDNQFADSRCHTLAHSCVLIDGGGQARSGCGTGTNGYIRAFENDAVSGYALVDAAEAYQRNYRHEAGVGARKALRHNLFVKPFQGAPAYAAVFDDIEKDDNAHEFIWQLIAWEDKDVEVRPHGAILRSIQPASGSQYVITPAAAPEGTCEWTFETKEQATWRVFALTAAMGDITDKSDSMRVQLDGGTIQQYHFQANAAHTWNWGEVDDAVAKDGKLLRTPFKVELPAGRHTLRFLSREPEAALAEVLLTCDPAARAGMTNKSDRRNIVLKVADATVTGGMERRAVNAAADSNQRVIVRLSSEQRLAAPFTDVYAPQDERSPRALQRLRCQCHAVNPYFAALLLPLHQSMTEPAVEEKRTGKAIEWTIQWPTHTDVITWDGVQKPQINRK